MQEFWDHPDTNPTDQDEYLRTILFWVLHFQKPGIAQWLLDQDMDCNHVDANGNKPIACGASCNHEPAKEVIYTLLNEPNLRIVSLKSF